MRILWSLATNIRMFCNSLRLLKHPSFAETLLKKPRFAVKCLSDNYLFLGSTVAERTTCFLNHYMRLIETLPNPALRQILRHDVVLYECCGGEDLFKLSIGMSRQRNCDKEGELSLVLKSDRKTIFTLSFTIIPGRIVKSEAEEVLLISRLQGERKCFPQQMKLAIEAMHGVRPRALVFAALEGFAAALGISEIAAVCATNHIAYCEEFDAAFKNGYDNFFTELGMDKTAAGFFLTSVPIEGKPLSLIKRGHKIRTKRKRAFTDQIRLACAESVLKLTGRIAGSSGIMRADTILGEMEPTPDRPED
jgi:uncharacterized protein VirK/YbjX